MADVLTPEQRHRNMASIRSRDTKPEIKVRRLLHGLGYRFKLHGAGLPGKPDIILPRHRKIIFVNGCFWHMHRCRYGKVMPKTNVAFWKKKRLQNRQRDIKTTKNLRIQGWQVLTLWECQIKDDKKFKKMLLGFLN